MMRKKTQYNFLFFVLTVFYMVNVIGARPLVIAPPVFGLEWWFGILLITVTTLLFRFQKKGYIFLSLVVLLIWGGMQFWVHWRWVFVSVTEKNLAWYNRVFGNTFRIFPVSPSKMIPDFYHLILHLLIVVTLLACFKLLFQPKVDTMENT
jgi:hypothetical protein